MSITAPSSSAVRVGFAMILAGCSGRTEVRGDGGVGPPLQVMPSVAQTPSGLPPELEKPPSTTSSGSSEPDRGAARGGFVIDHASIDSFDHIPAGVLAKVRGLRVFYGRLSHGDQLMGGLSMIHKSKGANYDLTIETFYSSLDPGRETPEWEKATRDRLAKGQPDVVMWAWSGNVGRPDRGGTDEYIQSTLSKLDKLEKDFPKVRFVYFTGPTQTWKGADGYAKANASIRKYAIDHHKVLYDFEDIDTHSPDGAVHNDTTDACEWCDAWCASHDCNMLDASVKCVENHHTHCLNDYRKGQALWVLLARLTGWDGK